RHPVPHETYEGNEAAAQDQNDFRPQLKVFHRGNLSISGYSSVEDLRERTPLLVTRVLPHHFRLPSRLRLGLAGFFVSDGCGVLLATRWISATISSTVVPGGDWSRKRVPPLDGRGPAGVDDWPPISSPGAS